MAKTAVTIRDVAKKAGVSVATVSRYINNTAPVAPETAARLEAVMKELNYVPNVAARNLATHKTHTVGLLLTEISGEFFAPLLKGIEAECARQGYNLLVASLRRRQSSDLLPVGPHNADGILAFVDSVDAAQIRYFYERHFPLVLIHQSAPEGIPIPCVTVENKKASCEIVTHLIEVHGRREIVFLRGPQGYEDSYWREQGYLEALQKAQIPVNPQRIAQGDFDRFQAEKAINELLQKGISFDAVFAGDDESAIGVLIALQQAGLQVPEDVAVVGFDDQQTSSYLLPPLTTVRAPTEAVGAEAARQLIALIDGQEVPPLTLMPTEIVLRQSCGC